MCREKYNVQLQNWKEMIQSKELRVGNLLLHPIQNCICEVIEVKVDCVKVKYTTDRERYSIVHLDDIQPITITEEILVNNGFEAIEYDFLDENEKGLSHLELKINEDLSICWADYLWISLNGTMIPVNDCNSTFLHQLQNLFFSLKGQELEVNL